jgi:septum site-determining protein MinD
VLSETASEAVKAFHNVVRRLEGEAVDFLDLNPPPEGFFARLRRLFTAQ